MNFRADPTTIENLIPLSGEINSDVGADSFDKKILKFKGSELL